MAKPFIKWAGGKGYLVKVVLGLIHQVDKSLPYCEPMVGGGAILFSIGKLFKSCSIADVNPELINLYAVIRDNLDELVAELSNGYFFVNKADKESADNYHRIRSSKPTDSVKRAARILFLLKTCFNGLMRVNQKGEFNVPMGSYTNPNICDLEVLTAASNFLQGVAIKQSNVIDTISSLPSKHFLFVDPPYHDNSDKKFTNYSGRFTNQDQENLINLLGSSTHDFIYTNRATDFILSNLKNNNIDYDCIALRHSIQPKHTTGMVESEVFAFRY